MAVAVVCGTSGCGSSVANLDLVTRGGWTEVRVNGGGPRDDARWFCSRPCAGVSLAGGTAWWEQARTLALAEAADLVSNGEDCGCGGCDSCVLLGAALRVRELVGTAPAAPLVLRWDGSVGVPGPGDPAAGARIGAVTDAGIPAVLVVDADRRTALAGLLDAEIRDVTRACGTPGCGVDGDDVEACDVGLWGWALLRVGGSTTPLRWYCSPPCVHDALARAGDELATADDAAGCTPGADA